MITEHKVTFVEVNADYDGQRIDNYLMRELKGVSKNLIYRLIRKGSIRVNKKRIAPSYRLQTNDIIRVPPLMLTDKNEKIKPSESLYKLLSSRIIHEDDGLIILNKPSGLAVHSGSGIHVSLIDALRVFRPKETCLELVHRLDRETSGCLIIAKKRTVLKKLHELLREGQVHKEYIALTKGHWDKKITRVDAPLVKHSFSSGSGISKISDEGKKAISVFEVLREFDDCSLVKVKLLTGRMHQIRAHANYVNHPLAGDDKYGDKDFNKEIKQLGLRRLFLHAAKISFALSPNEKPITVEAPLDDELISVSKLLKG